MSSTALSFVRRSFAGIGRRLMGQVHLRPCGPRRVLEFNGWCCRLAARRSAYGLSNTHFLRVLEFRELLSNSRLK